MNRFVRNAETKLRKMMKAKLNRCYYRGVGNGQVMADSLAVEFSVDGDLYTHKIPNDGWNYMNQSLRFMAYAGIQPTDFDGHEFSFEKDIYIPVLEKDGEYRISKKPLQAGMYQLQEENWFNAEGDVWNSDGNGISVGSSSDPGTGNRAGVPVDGEEEE